MVYHQFGRCADNVRILSCNTDGKEGWLELVMEDTTEREKRGKGEDVIRSQFIDFFGDTFSNRGGSIYCRIH